MTPEVIVDIFHHTLWVIVLLVSVIILPGLVVGLIVAMFQAATQINEMTLNFLPRLLVTLFALMAASPWLLRTIIDYTQGLITDIPLIIG